MHKSNNGKLNVFLKTGAGFTFIEVLIVMGLVSVLLVMGIMSMLSYIGKQNLESEARAVIALMRDAQSKSMAQEADSRWGVYISNQSDPTRDFYVLFQEASSSPDEVPGVTIERKTVRANIEFGSPVEGATTSILFAKISGLPSASTTVVIQKGNDSSDQKTIYISGNGKLDYQ